ncbi:MAG: hypothetical protein VX642_02115 [Bdellovibrionota bacterium]|nr:hypothetical protein [Bdellovibrionota bacterium]
MPSSDSNLQCRSIESLAIFIGLVSTYFLHSYYDMPVILVSAASCLLVDLIFKRPKLITGPFYCGSFAGMISTAILPNDLHVFFLSLICILVYQLSKKIFIGFGGKLGSIAFVSSMISLLIGALWN